MFSAVDEGISEGISNGLNKRGAGKRLCCSGRPEHVAAGFPDPGVGFGQLFSC